LRRVLLIGLDGLEYDYVVKYHFPVLLQKQHGCVPVPLPDYPVTGLLWAMILTGRENLPTTPLNKNILCRLEDRGIIKLLRKLRITKIIGSSLAKKAISLLVRRGYNMVPVSLRDYNVKTIFDVVTPSIAISFPALNLWPEIGALFAKYSVVESIKREKLRIRLEQELWTIERRKYDEALRVLKDASIGWRLFAVHFFVTDTIPHMYPGDIEKQLQTYRIVELWVEHFLQYTTPEDLVLIVSDHGLKNGLHTDHAFWSVNKDIEPPKKLTDFYHIILEYLGVSSSLS